jgi:formyl-CoA transferase
MINLVFPGPAKRLNICSINRQHHFPSFSRRLNKKRSSFLLLSAVSRQLLTDFWSKMRRNIEYLNYNLLRAFGATMNKDAKGLLEGVRVLDLSRVLAGPYCTMVLGDLGADVIKVEELGRGDDTRQWGPPFTKSGISAYFISANRNKRSLTLNIKSTGGLKILKDLVRKSDVLVENFKVGTLEKLGLSYEELKKIKPDLIYCTITGYGYTGPSKDKPGYDFISQAQGGLMSITGPANGEPIRVGIAIVDIQAGLNACNAILASLFARERQKTGQRIDISLLDTQVGMLTYAANNYLVSGKPAKRYGNAHPNIVPYQSFKAKDGYFAFAAGNDLQWSRFCKEIGEEDWVEDVRFKTNPDRVINRTELISILDDLFATKTVSKWLEICEKATVPAARINNIEEVFQDPQVQARNLVIQEEIDGETISMLASPLNISTTPVRIRNAPPKLGEQSQEILRELLGYTDGQVEDLKEQKII